MDEISFRVLKTINFIENFFSFITLTLSLIGAPRNSLRKGLNVKF